jgi:peptidase A4-like protein
MRRLLPAVVLSLLALPATAFAGTSTSSNWAGYAVHRSGVRFRSVSAAWTVPAVSCTGRSGYSANWVGLGGYHTNAAALEQIGTESDCTSSGRAVYSAWYELVPDISRNLSLTVQAGDRVSARVDVEGRTVRLHLRDLTRGTAFARTLTARAVDTTAAEWIVEAPSACTTARCRILPLASFAETAFNSAHATSATGHTGTISDPLWAATAIDLAADGAQLGGPGGRENADRASASTGALSASGGSFTVTAT